MNIGFVINNIANSDLAFDLLNTLHTEGEKSNNNSYYIFYQNISPPVMSLPCLAMNITGLANFKGKAVALNLESAEVLSKNNSQTKNYLYLWDLPWLNSVVNYEMCVDLLNNFTVIVRSESHKQNLYNYTGRNDILIAESVTELLKCLI
jgi:hypothetical protein